MTHPYKMRPRPIVLLMGGIGNRLFQVSRAYDLQRLGLNPVVVAVEDFADLHFLTRHLLGWTQHPQWIDMRMLCKKLGLEWGASSIRARLHIYSELVRSWPFAKNQRFNLPLEQDNRVAQIGYFQGIGCISSASLQAVSEAIVELLDLSTVASANAVLHIRGGDFAAEDRLSEDQVLAFINKSGGECICLTNDPGYVGSTYPMLDIPASDGPKSDFMTLCRARLIQPSNSTFCFWGCVIATQKYGATLWTRPRDTYWCNLDGSFVNDND